MGDLAFARSGDKGSDANIGVWARTLENFEFLSAHLTAEVVREHFSAVCRGRVRRYELPNLLALNFVLEDALDGGASSSLRLDAQGKTYGQGMRFIELEVPQDVCLSVSVD